VKEASSGHGEAGGGTFEKGASGELQGTLRKEKGKSRLDLLHGPKKGGGGFKGEYQKEVPKAARDGKDQN